MTSDLHDRVIGDLMADPAAATASVRPSANDMTELRVYDAAGVLLTVYTILPNGSYLRRET